jgi:hypothetical protein
MGPFVHRLFFGQSGPPKPKEVLFFEFYIPRLADEEICSYIKTACSALVKPTRAPLALQLAKRVRFLHHLLPYQPPQIIAACAPDVLEAFPRNDREWADVVAVLYVPPPEPDDRATALATDVVVASGRAADGVAPAASGDERMELSHESPLVEEPLKALHDDPNDAPTATGQVYSHWSS